MRFTPIVLTAAFAIALSGCTVVGLATDVAGAAGSVVSTAASVTGDIVGAAAHTVTGGGDQSKDKDSH